MLDNQCHFKKKTFGVDMSWLKGSIKKCERTEQTMLNMGSGIKRKVCSESNWKHSFCLNP